MVDTSLSVVELFIGFEYNEIDKSGLCAQTRASSLAGGMPVW